MERCGTRSSFTLTMWDVKKYKLTDVEIIEVRFYLNYVGCKVIRISEKFRN